MTDLDAVMAALVPLAGQAEGAPEPLDGGITNRNFRVRLGGRDCVVRLPGSGTALLGIDRAAEAEAATAAAAAGVGPAVVAHLSEPPCLVCAFLPGPTLDAAALRAPAMLEQAGRALRTIHAGPPQRTRFDAFAVVEGYAATVREHGGDLPEGFAALAQGAAAIRAALAGPEHDPVPCHNDLLPANFLHDGERLWILDWEYAGMGDRYFDLANLSVNCGCTDVHDERLLASYWDEPCTPRRFAALRLMRIMSDLREAMWGAVQCVASELDFDFAGYRDEHAGRARAALADPRVPAWLDAVGGGRG
jgi:thiamine kinase-like enzyme